MALEGAVVVIVSLPVATKPLAGVIEAGVEGTGCSTRQHATREIHRPAIPSNRGDRYRGHCRLTCSHGRCRRRHSESQSLAGAGWASATSG